MSPDSPTTAEIAPDPQLEKRTRRRFSAPEKLRLLAQADALAHGEQGAWLRRNGLYAAPERVNTFPTLVARFLCNNFR
jgi:hypothetical protein